MLIAAVTAGLVEPGRAFEGFAHPATVTVALVLVALAMARPTIRGGGGFLGTRRVGIVVGLDASFSMRHGWQRLRNRR